MKKMIPQRPHMQTGRKETKPAMAWYVATTTMFACLLLGPWAMASAAAAHSTPPRPVTDQQSNDEQVLRTTLDNGLTVVIVPNHLAPVVTTVMNYHVGSNEAPPGFPGMAHAQEHMMFRGSPGLTAGQLSAIAAAMGGRFNADTQQAVTQYFFTVPARFLDLALHIESIRMHGVLDSQALWEKERKAIEQEVARDMSNPGYRVYSKILARMFQDSPYAHDALGTIASFDKTTGAMLHKFYSHWYAPNNATLVIVGNVQPKQALQAVKSHLGNIKSSPLPARPEFSLQPVEPTTIHMKTDQPYGAALLAFRLPGYNDPDYAATQVLAQVLDSQRARLYSRLVPRGKALAAGFNLNTLRPGSIGLAVATFAKGDAAEPLLKDMRAIVQQVADDGVPADLVQAAKRRMITQAQAQQGSIPGLAMQWSQALVVQQLHSPAQQLQAIKNVTVQDVNRVLRNYLDPAHAIVAVLTPHGTGQATHAQGYGGKESFTPTHVGHVELPEWAAKPLAMIKKPVWHLQPSSIYLPNGLRLVVQPEDVSSTIHVYGHIKSRSGLATPPGKEGVARVLDQLFHYGTANLDRSALQKAFDDIGASASFGTDFSLLVQADDFDRGMQLLAAAELRPALPQSAFNVVRKQVTHAVASEIDSPAFKMQQALGQALYPADDPTLRHPTPASVSALTLKAVHDYYDKIFRPDLCTIVIVGNITPLQATQIVKKYFGQWQASGPAPATQLPAVPLNKPHVVAISDRSRVQDKAILAQTLGLTRSSPAYYPLVLGNQVLSGGFYASRLYSALREQRGLVYYVGTSVNAQQNRATFSVVYGAEPENVGEAHALVSRALHTMQTTPVGQQELHRAKAELVRQVPLHQASESAIARGLLAHAVKGLPLNESVRAARHYLRLDAKDVQKAYSKWIRPHGFVQVTQGPSPQ